MAPVQDQNPQGTPFTARVSTTEFVPPTRMLGYLPQVNEWGKGRLEWELERDGGKDHIPIFRATPVFNGERLEQYASNGASKKEAKERAASLMAQSGHC